MICFILMFYLLCNPFVILSIESLIFLYACKSCILWLSCSLMLQLLPVELIFILLLLFIEIESFFINYYFKRVIYCFCCPFCYFNVFICYSACFKFLALMLYVVSPYKQTPSIFYIYFYLILSPQFSNSSGGIAILLILNRFYKISTLLTFFYSSYSVYFVIRSYAYNYQLRCIFTQSLSLSLAAKLISIIFCFSNSWLLYPSSADSLFSDYRFFILFSYSLIIF